MELVVDKHGVISNEGNIPEEFYDLMTDDAVTLISLLLRPSQPDLQLT